MSRLTAITDAGRLVDGLKAGDRRVLAHVVTELERLSPEAPALLQAMEAELGRCLVVGITGPPGAGKSTLVNALIRHLREQGTRVGVIAVDPSSPVSKGAILGDRIRMTAALDDDGVYVRSLAAQGHLGGLSPAAVRIIDVLDAAGFGIVLIETVGTGQNEIDVAEVADVRVVVSAPGLGDGIQAMKAGLLEIADIMVVNKADHAATEQTLHHLHAGLGLGMGRSEVVILKTIATTGTGIAQLADAVAEIGRPLMALDPKTRRRRRARYLVRRGAEAVVAAGLQRLGQRRFDQLADDVLAGRISVDAAVANVLEQRPGATEPAE